ncbi:MAG: TrkH family potassium uptake protein [Ruminococcaceae bacterium]|nr:TrkH family potassium uptake protein [Oscillospiraceae bacterium]
MNRRMVLNTLGHIAMAEAALLVLPLIVSLIYNEGCAAAFLITIGICLIVGVILNLTSRPGTKVIYAKESFAIVAYAWLMMAGFGALPFVISGEIPSYIDAFFETVSGFTTTGASILTDVEAMSKGLLFWRSFTHWIGGMGVLVFVMALIPNMSDRSIHIMRAEMPGPEVGKLLPKARDTAKILYLIYIVLTAVEIVMLLAGGMPFFDSVVHTFGTAGTGGFGIKADSIAGYSPYLQWVIAVFMLVFALNFNLFYLIIIGKIKSVLKSTELWCFVTIVAISIGVIAVNIHKMYDSIEEVLRFTTFQVSSIISTTGYATTDFDLWPGLSKAVLMLLMIVGGCAGSTAGGLKVSRVILLIKSVFREFKKLLHPRSVRIVKLEGKRVDEQVLTATASYFVIYILMIISIFILLSIEPFSIETNLSATLACFNNIGPGFGTVGPTLSYSEYSAFSKIILSIAMLLGRLEIFPLILGLNPLIWKKR